MKKLIFSFSVLGVFTFYSLLYRRQESRLAASLIATPNQNTLTNFPSPTPTLSDSSDASDAESSSDTFSSPSPSPDLSGAPVLVTLPPTPKPIPTPRLVSYTNTPRPTYYPTPFSTPFPTATPRSTPYPTYQATPWPTSQPTPFPTPTPYPTYFVIPTPEPTPWPTPTPRPASGYSDGLFVGDVVDAYYGNVQVQASIQNGKIMNVQFLQYPDKVNHSRMLNATAMPILQQEAIQAQSAQVNIVTSATATSQAFITSLQSALNKAKL